MNDQTDSQLLNAWAKTRSEPAFADLVRRHVDLVHSAALRMVSDSHLAEDVTQRVFVALAKSAAQITDCRVLAGWLHRTAQNIAAETVSTDVRRRAREQEAADMNQLLAAESDAPWEHIAPHLDAALGELTDPDRDAVLLRYFERKSAREMAQILGTSEDAAQRRVSRAVERLREFFAKRGVTVGASGLVVVISANAVQAAPVGLAVTISTAAVLTGTTIATAATATAVKTIAMTTFHKTIVTVTVAALAGTAIYEARQASQLREQVQVLQQQQSPTTEQIQQLQRERDEAANRLTWLADENATLKRNLEAATPSLAKPAQSFDWRMVESDDYKKYIANLRTIGCPEETICDIITADVNKLFNSRSKQMRAGKKFEFWKTGSAVAPLMDVDQVEKQQQLREEKHALLKELLGVEPEEKFDLFTDLNSYEEMLDFLPPEKQKKLMQMMQEMQVKMMKMYKNGEPDAADMKGFQQAQEAEMAKLLSSQELEEYKLRLSPIATTMRIQLAGFDPTEQEFRDIFKLRKKYDERPEFDGTSTGKKEMDAQLKNILGDARFAEYERAQDWGYQAIAKVAEREGLPRESAAKVYDLKKVAEAEAGRIHNDSSLSAEQRTAALRGIHMETEKAIKQVFGDKGWKSYESGAGWLRNISQGQNKN